MTRDMLKHVQERGFQPAMVVFDSWYASRDNLKCIRDAGWTFLTCILKNRKVSLVRGVTVQVGLTQSYRLWQESCLSDCSNKIERSALGNE